MPDGVDAAADGGFWISLVAPAPPFKPLLLSKMLANPLVRALYARLRPGLKAWGAVVKADADGRALQFLTDPTGRHVSAVSAVTEAVVPDHASGSRRRRLFLGNLVGSYVSYIDLGPADSAADEAGDAEDAAADATGGDAGVQHQEEL
ncbi:hypothetical protein OEZ86_005826 [Tetradesmus obliquus]|nr:hypothetical protein OEZ86_005826 [Tetradesmus obliquus]